MSDPSITEAAIVQKTLEIAQATEKKIDAELKQLSQLDENDIESLRRKRIEEMRKRAQQEQQWKTQGHLQYTELRDEKEWFQAAKESERLICHFYRASTWRCQIVDRHMEAIAKKHVEARFCKINAENCPYLAEKLQIVLMPTIIMTLNNFTHDRIEGFDELGGRDDFVTDVFEKRIAKKNMIDYEEPPAKALEGKAKPTKNAVKSNKTGKAIYASRSRREDDSDNSESDTDERYL